MQNIYPDLMIKIIWFSGNRKNLYIFFQPLAVCVHECAFMHPTLLVGEIADRFRGEAL